MAIKIVDQYFSDVVQHMLQITFKEIILLHSILACLVEYIGQIVFICKRVFNLIDGVLI